MSDVPSKRPLPALDPNNFRTSLMRPATPPPSAPEEGGTPSPLQILDASPSVVRLCRAFDDQQIKLIARGRFQRVGLAAMVTMIIMGTGVLAMRAQTERLLPAITVAVAVSSLVALAILALLWLRDTHRLRDIQGDRFVRALGVRCSLDQDEIAIFLQKRSPTVAFFECFAAYKKENNHQQVASTAL